MSSGPQDTSSAQSALKDTEKKAGGALDSAKESVTGAFSSAKETISDKFRDLTGQKSAQVSFVFQITVRHVFQFCFYTFPTFTA